MAEIPETHDGEIARRAVAILRRIVEGGSWYSSAIELDTYAGLDGEDLLIEAKRLLRDADITEEISSQSYTPQSRSGHV